MPKQNGIQKTAKKRILVIDDEEAITELIKLKLERSNFEVYTASDGVEGLEVFSRVKPELIILDILMPRMDGFQFYKKLHEKEKTTHTPILILTARSAMKDTFEELGVSDFLVKPFEPEELLFRVKKILVDSSSESKPLKQAIVAGSDEQKIESMRAQLTEKGYNVTVATDGPGALGKALQVLPELFVVQFDMPGMGADEIVKILDSHPGAENVSVVVYSAFHTDEEVKNSPWGRFLRSDQKKKIRKADAPLHLIDKFDAKSFVDKIKNFL